MRKTYKKYHLKVLRLPHYVYGVDRPRQSNGANPYANVQPLDRPEQSIVPE